MMNQDTTPTPPQNGQTEIQSLETSVPVSPPAAAQASASANVHPNPLNIPPHKKPFKKRRALAIASLLILTLILGLFALRLYSSSKKNLTEKNVLDTYGEAHLQALGVVRSEATPLSNQRVSVNGDLILNEGIALSPDAVSTISNSLTNKVTLNTVGISPIQAGNIAISGTVLASVFQGNGSNLSNLNASALTSGTVSNDRLDPTITRLGQVIPISALSTGVLTTINGVSSNAGNINIEASGGLTVTNDPTNNKIILTSTSSGGDISGVIAGTGLTGGGLNGDVTLNVDTGIVTVQGNTFNGVDQLVKLDGSGALPVLSGNNLSNLNASNISSGTLNDSRLSTNVTTQGNSFNGNNNLVKLNGAGELPVLSAINLTNLNATNIVAGSLDDNRLSANVTLQGNTFNAANKLVKLDGSGNLPALNGSALTNLNASNLGTGTVGDARLSANVALLGANQTFSGNVVFSQPLTVNTIQPSASMVIGATNQSLTLQGDLTTQLTASSGGNKVSLAFNGTPTGNVIYNLDAATTPGTYTLCTTVGNCASSGGGVTTLGGTTGKLTRFTGSQSIGDSSISDTGTLVTVSANGLFKAGADSTTAFRVQQAATSNNVFTVDTSNSRVAIGQNTASYPLDVAGDINSTTGLRVGGNLVCDSTGCAAGSGSGFYIQNGTALQTPANINIESTATTSPTIVLKAKTSQTADLLTAKDSSSAVIAQIDSNGNFNTTGQYKVSGTQISSANLSNNANLAKLDGTQTFTAINTFKNAADSTSAFKIQNAAGSSTILAADTSNNRIAIGQASAGYTLDVNGDVNIAGGNSYRINGVAICGPTATCAPSSGSDSYVQNGLTLQTANFNIQSAQASGIVGIVQGAVGQSADLLQARDSGNAVLAKITSTGAIYQGANQVCDASNNCGYATTSGSGNYIQNTTSTQTANMNIQSASTSQVTSVIQGAGAQTADILQVKDGTAQANLIFSANQTTQNLITNGSFESDLSGWTAKGGATLSRISSGAYIGNGAMQIAASTTNDGTKFNVGLSSSTQYTLSYYMENSTATSFSNFTAGYSNDGSTDSNCTSSPTATATTVNWTRFSCTFTTSTVSGSPYVFIKLNSAVARTFNLDAVQLETTSGTSIGSGFQQGTLNLNGVVTSPVTLKNITDSTTAFQVQRASGAPLFSVGTAGTFTANTMASPQVNIDRCGAIVSTSSNAQAVKIDPTGGCSNGSTQALAVFNSGLASTPIFAINNYAGPGTSASVATVKARADSTALRVIGNAGTQTADVLQIQNGNNSNNIVSVAQNSTNLLGNPSFESSTNPWTVLGSTPTISRSNTERYSGSYSLMPTTSGAAGDGVKIPYSLAASTTYSFSIFMKASGSNFSTLEIGYSPDTTTQTACISAQTVTTTNWTRFTCTFTTGTVSGPAGNRFVYLKMTDAVARTFYADAANLEISSGATNYSMGNISLNGTITSPTVFQNQTDSSTAFQIQNAAGDQVLGVDTTSASNLVTNPSFESSTTGWTAAGSAVLSRTTAAKVVGSAALQIAATAATGDGAKYPVALASSTTYSLSYYAENSVATAFTPLVGRSDDGSTDTACTPSPTTGLPAAVTWTRYSCTFTTGTVSGSPYIYIKIPSANARTFYIDAVQLETGSIASNYSAGAISLNGNVTSPVTFRNQSDSTNAFTIQNAAGTTQLSFDTTGNGALSIYNSTGRAITIANNKISNNSNTLQLEATGGNTVDVVNSGSSASVPAFRVTGSSASAVQAQIKGAASQSADVFQVTNNNTAAILSAGQSNTNLITNPSFDIDTSGWSAITGNTISRITTDQYSGTGSLSNVTTATANAGTSFPFALAASTTYSLSVYARATGSNFSTFQIGYTNDGTTFTSCLTGQTVVTTGWTRYTCSFTVSASPSGTRFVYFRQTDATARTFYVDAVQLEAAAASTPYSLGTIGLNGNVNSPTTFQNQSNSLDAFKINNATGTSLFNVDTTSGAVSIGSAGTETGTINVANGTGALTLNLGTGATGSKTINIGTGAVSNAITLGNATTGTTVTVNAANNFTLNGGNIYANSCAACNIQIGLNGWQQFISIGNQSSNSSLSLYSGTSGINMTSTGQVNLTTGSTYGGTFTFGGGGFNLQASGGASLASNTTTNNITLGASLTSGYIQLGGSSSNPMTGNIDLGIGNGAQAINIGTGAAAKTLTLGSTTTTTGLNFKVGATATNGITVLTGKTSGTQNLFNFTDGSADNLGSISIDTTANTTTYNTTSDKRLKENIADTHYTLNDLLKISVADYSFITDPTHRTQTGFLAQDLYAIFPDAVKVGGADASTDPWAVDYGRLTPLLVKSIQELNTKVDKLASPVTAQTLSQATWDGGLVSKNTEFSGLVSFDSFVTFKSKVTFAGDVDFAGRVSFADKDVAGIVTMNAGTKTTHVTFTRPYAQAPIVTATPKDITGNYAVQNVTTDGFDIVLPANTSSDVTFNWIALLVK